MSSSTEQQLISHQQEPNPRKKIPTTPLLMMEASLASSGALLFSNPFELLKTRLQLQGELQKASEVKVVYRGMLHGVGVVGKNEGLLALYQGISSAIVHQIVMNGIRIGLYDTVRQFLKEESANYYSSTTPSVPTTTTTPGVKAALRDVPLNITSAFTVGVLGAFVGSPFFLMKTRLQALNASKQLDKVGQQHQYKGMIDGMTKIYNSQGLRGLWSGAVSCMIRTGIGSSAQIPMYSFIKDVGVQQYGFDSKDIRLHTFCSLCAANNIVLWMCPVDTIMTRMFNNTQHDSSRSTMGIIRGMRDVLKIEGVAGLYRGWIPLWWRTFPHSLATFVIWEQIQKHREETTLKMMPSLYR